MEVKRPNNERISLLNKINPARTMLNKFNELGE
jgi:hypothetical protein